ncbi:hypothetical protein SOVF_025560 isoform B [Spinacia oleracea]|nr:hypothetical protein SOVF_025560 isoform B [Spinacia oleracea]
MVVVAILCYLIQASWPSVQQTAPEDCTPPQSKPQKFKAATTTQNEQGVPSLT